MVSEHFVNLNCANCGAKLDVYDDLDRFSCSFCGTELVAQRRGGTVALRAVTEAISKVQVGTDKTAAELAITRYEKELQMVRSHWTKAAPYTILGILAFLYGIGTLPIGLTMIFSMHNAGPGIAQVVFGALALWWSLRQFRESPRRRALRQEISRLESLLVQKKQIANS
jgi:ribosomal protein S27E